ncbi:multiple antibiotic resistance protein [Tropicimonas sediminicola]|uniref:UPF0056 membrane protein n=1 Tax=Tropicimonas sediminicola TaxID=1031541 RepID=A0A239HSN9_9RHOB|nr:multiple antibiotic resistance protein [Tropicimonas sediminicola]
MLTDKNHFPLADQAFTAAVMAGALAVTCNLMLLAGPIIRLIGNSGAAIANRVMGMILASVAADTVMSALLELAGSGSLRADWARSV